jgi:hypothetical protein
MRHKNQEDWNRIRSQLHWAGRYTSFRYGTIAIRETHGSVDARSRITLAGQKKQTPVFGKHKRKHIIDRLFEAMSDWRFSPFQFEGATRAHIRSVLCTAGYSWQRSDDEAAMILAEVLKGYPRPSYNEGQPSYTASIVTCKGCGGPLDEYEVANGIRFCCVECERMSKNRTTGLSQGFIELGPTKCANPKCPEVFFPKDAFQKFCRPACSVEGRGLVLPMRDCAFCGEPFQPTHETSMYCCPQHNRKAKDARKKEARHAAKVDAKCLYCGGYFTPKKADARYCSEKHQKRAAYLREKAAKAARMTNSDSAICKLFDQAA